MFAIILYDAVLLFGNLTEIITDKNIKVLLEFGFIFFEDTRIRFIVNMIVLHPTPDEGSLKTDSRKAARDGTKLFRMTKIQNLKWEDKATRNLHMHGLHLTPTCTVLDLMKTLKVLRV